MERNNGRYNAYIRRQGSAPHNHHHHNNNTTSAASSLGPGAAPNSAQYSNSSISNASPVGGGGVVIGAGVGGQQHNNSNLSQHDELIRYIREAWNKVNEQGTPIIYCNESDNQLKNFKPFNLEEYWGQRLVQNIHVTTTHAGGHQ
ncbi:uncharacterized protein LOC6651869 [Drosophila willistoni]|uniref:uncharacterized protein LOC6651869 n=1 Tax=Drosophila willistoni TaxID=7260 RepID=UPI001F087154|nr:uncharacterized protein LOC6651869 [Drosophila willistoni]